MLHGKTISFTRRCSSVPGAVGSGRRKYMRNGSMDLGMVLVLKKTGTKTWRYKIYPEKLKQIPDPVYQDMNKGQEGEKNNGKDQEL